MNTLAIKPVMFLLATILFAAQPLFSHPIKNITKPELVKWAIERPARCASMARRILQALVVIYVATINPIQYLMQKTITRTGLYL